MRTLLARRVVAAACAVGLFGLSAVSSAQEDLGKPRNGCGPRYLAMDPGASQYETVQFFVRVQRPPTRQGGAMDFWETSFVFPSSARCHEARSAVADALKWGGDPRAMLSVGDCR
jgi:hypothetical protein